MIAADDEDVLRRDLRGPADRAGREIHRHDRVARALLRFGVHVAGRRIDDTPLRINRR